jgi:hypothetical protein
MAFTRYSVQVGSQMHEIIDIFEVGGVKLRWPKVGGGPG